MLTGIKDLDAKILNGFSDKDLLNYCETNKKELYLIYKKHRTK